MIRVQDDFFLDLLEVLETNRIYYCLLGGFAVNSYVEPQKNPDMELVVERDQLGPLVLVLKKRFKVERFFRYIKVHEKHHAAQARILTGDRYQLFVGRTQLQNILGGEIPVASLKNVLKAKEWSALDKNTRPEERRRDLADIARILAVKPSLDKSLSMKLRKHLAVR